MRALTHRFTALLAALWLSGCDGYAPPCDVAARHDDVANGAQGALIADADGGALLVDCLNPLAPSPVARVVKISIDGAVTSEHVIPLPDEPWAQPWAPGPGPTAGMPLPSCTWAGGGLGVITSNEEPVELRTGASGVRSTLVYRFVDTNGVAQPERTLEGSDCVDCQLSWTAVPHGDRIALLVSKAPLVQPGSIPAQELFVLDGGGEARARHDLAWLATRVSLRGSQRANGLVLRSHRAVWLLDDESRRVTSWGSRSTPAPTATPASRSRRAERAPPSAPPPEHDPTPPASAPRGARATLPRRTFLERVRARS